MEESKREEEDSVFVQQEEMTWEELLLLQKPDSTPNPEMEKWKALYEKIEVVPNIIQDGETRQNTLPNIFDHPVDKSLHSDEDANKSLHSDEEEPTNTPRIEVEQEMEQEDPTLDC